MLHPLLVSAFAFHLRPGDFKWALTNGGIKFGAQRIVNAVEPINRIVQLCIRLGQFDIKCQFVGYYSIQ